MQKVVGHERLGVFLFDANSYDQLLMLNDDALFSKVECDRKLELVLNEMKILHELTVTSTI